MLELPSDLILVFDREAPDIHYGYYRCPICRSEWYGGGPALHRSSCAAAGRYDGMEYVFGPKAARHVLAKDRHTLNPFGKSALLAAIPNIRERLADA